MTTDWLYQKSLIDLILPLVHVRIKKDSSNQQYDLFSLQSLAIPSLNEQPRRNSFQSIDPITTTFLDKKSNVLFINVESELDVWKRTGKMEKNGQMSKWQAWTRATKETHLSCKIKSIKDPGLPLPYHIYISKFVDAFNDF